MDKIMSSSVLSRLDRVADSLESHGYIKEAYRLDLVANELGQAISPEVTSLENLITKLDQNKKYTILKSPYKGSIGSVTQKVHFKPSGLWYSCGTEWLKFIAREYESAIGLYIYEVRVTGPVLKIDNFSRLLEFTEKYKKDDVIPGMSSTLYIDWPRVAQDYPGIEICPYINQARMDYKTEWYYPWDVASGCVWRDGVVHLTLLYEFRDGEWIGAGSGAVSAPAAP